MILNLERSESRVKKGTSLIKNFIFIKIIVLQKMFKLVLVVQSQLSRYIGR